MQMLVQAAGRSNRSEDDWSETFIVDEDVQWFLRDREDLAPEWFLEAIVKTRRTVQPLDPIR